MEIPKYFIDATIEDYLRINLRALHKPTDVEVTFPQIHVLVEKIKDGDATSFYSASCLEYSQMYESTKAESAVAGLINYMFAYFFEALKKEGSAFLIGQAKDPSNDLKWAQIREFMASKRKHYMEFVHRSFNGANKEELLMLSKSIQ